MIHRPVPVGANNNIQFLSRLSLQHLCIIQSQFNRRVYHGKSYKYSFVNDQVAFSSLIFILLRTSVAYLHSSER